MEYLHYVSIVLEFVIAVMAVMSAVKGRSYMYGLAFTFLVYVVWDLSDMYAFGIPGAALTVLFFLATLSAMWSVWSIYKQN